MDNRQENIEKLRELIKDVKVAMLTTVDADGSLRSRPMATQQVEFDGDLWFFTRVDTAKVSDVVRDGQVNVSYASPDHQRYVSVSGTAQVVHDRQKREEFWNAVYEAWFPEGLKDPTLVLLKVDVQRAEYWTTPGGKVGQVLDFVRSLVSHDPGKLGENEKLDLN